MLNASLYYQWLVIWSAQSFSISQVCYSLSVGLAQTTPAPLSRELPAPKRRGQQVTMEEAKRGTTGPAIVPPSPPSTPHTSLTPPSTPHTSLAPSSHTSLAPSSLHFSFLHSLFPSFFPSSPCLSFHHLPPSLMDFLSSFLPSPHSCRTSKSVCRWRVRHVPQRTC